MSKKNEKVLEEVKKLKLERKKMRDDLKEWARGDGSIYDQNGMRIVK